ncbi:MAG: Hemolysin A [Firmicutes bacterium ADurb.Bin193]|nr:MAG: Hemolysin A [Firmicutes bacterium ADurb.Bin193]
MKKRLDTYLVENGFAPSREKARSIIMSGCVYIGGQRADKAGAMLGEGAAVEVRGGSLKYVSRGGLKLEKALSHFKIDLKGKICMDVGASTGGFTDCMLQNGAAKVYAVDVGYGQLAWILRSDERVVNLERKNIRYIDENDVADRLDFSSIDVSFISLKLVLPVVWRLLKEDGEAVALIKPQFEAGREQVGKKGVVRDIKIHEDVIVKVLDFTREIGFKIKGLTYSPIRGPKGNIEYLMYISKTGKDGKPDIKEVVEQSHREGQNEEDSDNPEQE